MKRHPYKVSNLKFNRPNLLKKISTPVIKIFTTGLMVMSKKKKGCTAMQPKETSISLFAIILEHNHNKRNINSLFEVGYV